MKTVRFGAIALVIAGVTGLGIETSRADTVAYQVPVGTVGTQAFAGPLGMDFNVNQPVLVTRLGVFDDGSDGLNRDLTAYLWDRTDTSAPLETLTFTSADPGTLLDGSRFKPLASPLLLPAGFQGTIVGENYGATEQNGNSGGAAPVWTTNDGGGLVSFVGSSPYGDVQGTYPANGGGGPENRYAAGTFLFADADLPGIEFTRPLYVCNASFELPDRYPPGTYYGTDPFAWTTSGAGNFLAGPYFSDPIPDGDHVAYANAGGSLTSDPLQGETLQADTLYILEAEWGRRTSYADSPLQSMKLRAGGVELGVVDNTDVGNGPLVPQGKFETARGYFTANHNAPIGSELDILLTSDDTTYQVAFDDVRLMKVDAATAVPIVNHSFEDYDVSPNGNSGNVPGWTAVSAGTLEYLGTIVPADGEQVAYVLPGGSLTQTLSGVSLEAGHRYFLLVEVGDRSSQAFAGYRVELLAGGQTIAFEDSLNVVDFTGFPGTSGEFITTSVIDFSTLNMDPLWTGLIGQPLGISLMATGTGGQTMFDNVRLFVLNVPEPATFLLLALGSLGMLGVTGWKRRKRARA